MMEASYRSICEQFLSGHLAEALRVFLDCALDEMIAFNQKLIGEDMSIANCVCCLL